MKMGQYIAALILAVIFGFIIYIGFLNLWTWGY